MHRSWPPSFGAWSSWLLFVPWTRRCGARSPVIAASAPLPGRPSKCRCVFAEAIRSESAHADVLLIDCFTLFVSNMMRVARRAEAHNHKHVRELCEAIRSSSASVIAVSNEVGSGIVPAFRSGRVYRDLLGQLNQEVAAIADNVVLMVAGLPVLLKRTRRPARESG